MSFGAILPVVIDGMHDTERLESPLVKGNRSIEIFDGNEGVVDQEFTSGIPTFQAQSSQNITLIYETLVPKMSAFPVRRSELPADSGKFRQRSGPSPEPEQRAVWANRWIGIGKGQMSHSLNHGGRRCLSADVPALVGRIRSDHQEV